MEMTPFMSSEWRERLSVPLMYDANMTADWFEEWPRPSAWPNSCVATLWRSVWMPEALVVQFHPGSSSMSNSIRGLGVGDVWNQVQVTPSVLASSEAQATTFCPSSPP